MKNKSAYLLLVAFSVFTFQLVAKTDLRQERDSLIQKLNTAKEDTNKIILYHDILYSYTSGNTEEGLKYVQPALALARKLNREVAWIEAVIGSIYWKLGQYDTALNYHFDALKLTDEKKDPKYFAYLNTIIGQDYADGGNYPEALKYFLKIKEVYLKNNNKEALANTFLLISFVYERQGNYTEAAKANLDALKVYESIKDNYGASIASANLADYFIKLDKNKEAIPYLLKSSEINLRTLDYTNLGGNYNSLATAYFNLNKYAEAHNYAALAFEIGKTLNDKVLMGDAKYKQADMYFLKNNFAEAVSGIQSAIGYYRLVNADHQLADSYSKLSICYVRLHDPVRAKQALDSAAYFSKQLDSRILIATFLNSKQLYDSLTGNWKDAYLNHYNYINIRDSIFNVDNTMKLSQTQNQYESDKSEAIAKAEQEKKDIRQRTIRNSITGVLAGSLIFLVVVYRQRNKISRARKRSDELLLNILPEEVAEELKQKGSTDAKHFNEVTVMFTDFKGFTQIAETLSPTELVNEIHECFKAFDHIISKYKIEKIKTIGDSYMCAGGLPVENTTHADDVVKAALEIQKLMQAPPNLPEGEESHRAGQLSPFGRFRGAVRIGIHTGPVVAGIVGIKKFAYDIWGDTVNIASRMESSGEAGKVNISGATYKLVKDKFNCIHRGKISAKNKGEIDMYFVDSINKPLI